jgi:hypothetical protein
MYTQHPTLLIGPSDWDESRMPRAEFERRIAALWEAFPDASQAIVFGSARNHAELAYLTNFVPKLEPGIALLTRDGAHKLLFGGGPNMLGAMRPLTFIADMAPLNTFAKAITGWTSPLLIGGDRMTAAVRKIVAEATGGSARDASAKVWAAMCRKSPAELAAIRDACAILEKAMATIRASARAGDPGATAVLAGERAAINAGAQDVRTLLSLDGGRTLRPFEALDQRRADPLQVYVAVRKFNYWAEGFACLSSRPNPAAAQAAQLLDSALAAIWLGLPHAQMSNIMAPPAPYRRHPVTEGALVNSIGLALGSPSDPADSFEADGVYSVRAGLSDGADAHAIVSAMVAVGDGGSDVLWRSALPGALIAS